MRPNRSRPPGIPGRGSAESTPPPPPPPPPPPAFLGLPKDALLLALSFLTERDLCLRVAPASRALRAASEDPWLWAPLFARLMRGKVPFATPPGEPSKAVYRRVVLDASRTVFADRNELAKHVFVFHFTDVDPDWFGPIGHAILDDPDEEFTVDEPSDADPRAGDSAGGDKREKIVLLRWFNADGTIGHPEQDALMNLPQVQEFLEGVDYRWQFRYATRGSRKGSQFVKIADWPSMVVRRCPVTWRWVIEGEMTVYRSLTQ